MDLKQIQEIYPEIPVGQAEDLSNKKFGRWKVLYRTKKNDSIKPTYWVCECECENKTVKPVMARSLTGGVSTSCGCLQKWMTSEKADSKIHQKDENGNIIKKRCFRCKEWLSLDNFWKNSCQKDGYSGECKTCQNTAKENRYNTYKKGVKKRNLNFTISKEEFYSLTSLPCVYCGAGPIDYNGIDRIDSSKGYISDNCVSCCEMCNKMKLDYSVEEWVEQMKKILMHLEANNE